MVHYDDFDYYALNARMAESLKHSPSTEAWNILRYFENYRVSDLHHFIGEALGCEYNSEYPHFIGCGVHPMNFFRLKTEMRDKFVARLHDEYIIDLLNDESPSKQKNIEWAFKIAIALDWLEGVKLLYHASLISFMSDPLERTDFLGRMAAFYLDEIFELTSSLRYIIEHGANLSYVHAIDELIAQQNPADFRFLMEHDLPLPDKLSETACQSLKNPGNPVTIEMLEMLKDRIPRYPYATEALRNAAERCVAPPLKTLLEMGADPKADYSMALAIAAGCNNLEVASFLLENGADPHNRNDICYTEARKQGYDEMLKLLEKYA